MQFLICSNSTLSWSTYKSNKSVYSYFELLRLCLNDLISYHSCLYFWFRNFVNTTELYRICSLMKLYYERYSSIYKHKKDHVNNTIDTWLIIAKDWFDWLRQLRLSSSFQFALNDCCKTFDALPWYCHYVFIMLIFSLLYTLRVEGSWKVEIS